MQSDLTTLFLAHSTSKLRQMCGHIETCLVRLNDDQIWSRRAAHENSIGNLVLHLCGNARQWICAGIGGEKDVRNRDGEFSVRGGLSGSDLIAHLKQTVEQATATLAGVTADRRYPLLWRRLETVAFQEVRGAHRPRGGVDHEPSLHDRGNAASSIHRSNAPSSSFWMKKATAGLVSSRWASGIVSGCCAPSIFPTRRHGSSR